MQGQKEGRLEISGQWLGTITQNPGGHATSYEFEVFLSQTGKKLRGRSYSRVDDVYTILELKGEIKGDKIIFLEETKIVDVYLYEGLEACYKKAQLVLSYKGGQWQMEGFWSGKTDDGDCIPGKVLLFKKVPRA